MTISIANQKGGVGKTTSTFFIGKILSERFNTLLIDFDQSNLTDLFNINFETTAFSCFKNNDPLSKAVINIKSPPTLDLIPSDIRTAGLDRLLSSSIRSDNYLKKYLLREPLFSMYEFTLIDCPPSLDLRLINALTASDYCLIACQTEPHSLKAINDIIQVIEEVQDNTNPNLKYKIFATMHNRKLNIQKTILNTINNRYPKYMLKTTIHSDVRIKEQHLQKGAITKSRAYEEYKNLTYEIINSLE